MHLPCYQLQFEKLSTFLLPNTPTCSYGKWSSKHHSGEQSKWRPIKETTRHPPPICIYWRIRYQDDTCSCVNFYYCGVLCKCIAASVMTQAIINHHTMPRNWPSMQEGKKTIWLVKTLWEQQFHRDFSTDTLYGGLCASPFPWVLTLKLLLLTGTKSCKAKEQLLKGKV